METRSTHERLVSLKPKYFIGDIGFGTQKAAEDYTRDIIASIGCQKIQTDHKHFKFFVDLIRNHSEMDEKIGCGIKYFQISKNKLNPKYYHTDLIRVDGTTIDFSWKSCAKSKKSDCVENLKSAMREYITDDIWKFKKEANLICCLCNVVNVEFHVDHNNPSFFELYNSFMEVNELQTPTLFDDNQFYQAKFRNNDSYFAQSWLKYHRKYAKLQILCAKCNLRKTKK